MAHFSGDESLCATLCAPGRDPFQALAARWRGVPDDAVTPEMRDQVALGCGEGECGGLGLGALVGSVRKVA
eukprot:363516-Chlamydomonas_euryale.AAC.24